MHRFAFLSRRTGAALLGLAGLFAAPAFAGPVSTLYLASYTTARLYAIQGDTVSAGAPTYCNHCEVPIAVDGDIRTLGVSGTSGGQYALDRTQTGVTYAAAFAPDAGVRLVDGSTDGQRNYAVTTHAGDSQGLSSVYGFGRDWSNTEKLFDIDFRIDAGGITYDPGNHSLWISGTYSNDGAIYGLIRDYALDGTLLSQFNAGEFGGAGLAMDYADGTLWTTRGPTQFFDRYSRDGTLLQTVSYDALSGQGGYHGIEFNLAGDARTLPEPGSWALAGLALLIGAGVRRRQRVSLPPTPAAAAHA